MAIIITQYLPEKFESKVDENVSYGHEQYLVELQCD